MDQELREIEALTRELLGVLERLWSEYRVGAPSQTKYLSDERQVPDL